MTDLLLVPVAIAYFGVVLSLFVFGVNFSYLTWSAWRQGPKRPEAEAPGSWPAVTIQLPIYNERYVAERLIDAVARIRYPRQLLQIQVLDDSTDDTTAIVANRVSAWSARGCPISHVRREGRAGYKAGALAHGLTTATGEYIALFDADFVPTPDFLERAVPVLVADAGLAFVQGRWGHTNRDQSVLTRVQAMSIDGHFGIEQQARWARGHPFNFNGTAGVWRRTAIDDAGGWSQRTLTEDLDLSYRAHLHGWRAAYVHDLEVPAELPVSLTAYRRQQHRWARGSLECAGFLIPPIWRSDMPLRSKIESTLHLGGYLIHLLLLSLVGLFPAIVLLSREYPTLLGLFGMMAVFNLAALAPSALFLSGQQRVGRRWYGALGTVVLLTFVGAGMMVNTARAAAGAFGGKAGAFERTPKFGHAGTSTNWRGLRYQGRLDRIVLVEVLAAGLCVWTATLAAGSGVWAITIYASIFAGGLGLNALLTIAQTVSVSMAVARDGRSAGGPIRQRRSVVAGAPPRRAV